MPMLEQKALLLLSKTAGELTMGTRPIPKPGPGQVLVKNVAAALNPADCLLKNSGRFVDEFGFPAVLGEDGSGTIVELGEGVKGWKVGDEVVYQSHANPDRGSFQEYSICDAVRLGKKPSSLTFEQAATIPAALGTATVGLYLDHAGPGRRSNGCGLVEPWAEGGRGKYTGKPLLVIGGSGSVGQLTIQLAKLSGFNPIITTASGKNEEYCREAGATHVVDYRNTPYTELAEAVRKITDKPVKYVYDAISTKETQEAGWNVLAPGGTIIVVLPAQVGKLNDVAEDGKRTASMSAWVHVDPHKELAERMYAALPGLIERGEIKPNRVEVIEGGLAGISAGVDRLEKKSVSGVKLVARIAETP